ncbi:MAG: cupin domain-containing protein [Bdellovibrionota bacterium]
MIITRWQAPQLPNKAQMKFIFENEGLDVLEESFEPQKKISEHRHPFCEIRMIVKGEMLFNISGNQFLLREGDRVEIPANTKHSYMAQGNDSCLSLCAFRAI